MKNIPKNRYFIDNSNRLVIRGKRKGLTPSNKQNQDLVTDGRFGTDKDNRLIYWLNKPGPWLKRYDSPSKISFEGKWRLSSNYDLELILNETKDQFLGEHFALKGEIISADKDALVFQMHSLDKYGQSHLQLLKLTGVWQANEYNEISFAVKKETTPDIFTFAGAWQLNKNQQIIYAYEKTDLKTKTRHFHTLTFQGFWQINRADRIIYILAKGIDSYFDFRVQLESPNLYPKEGVIKYRLGIGLKKVRPRDTRIISLYGTWKFSKKSGLLFVMDYGQGRLQAIEFGTELNLAKKDKVEFLLTNKQKQPLGLCITFTHRFLRQSGAETFLRFKKFRQDSRIEGGFRIPF